jgi:hypothetical protein
MKCKFHKATDSLAVCERCGREVKSAYPAGRVHAPCRSWPRGWEIGEWVAIFLAAAGITEGRWNWLRGRLGYVKPCKCGERKDALDLWGAKLAAWIVKRRKGEPSSRTPQ